MEYSNENSNKGNSMLAIDDNVIDMEEFNASYLASDRRFSNVEIDRKDEEINRNLT